MVKFEITTSADGDFMFEIKASNGEIIMTSQGYAAKSACQNGIKSAKTHSINKNLFRQEIAPNGNFYFSLTSLNRQIIGTSQMYDSRLGRDNGIDSVFQNAQHADVKDLSIV